MERAFRIYNRLNSSYFDLISGDRETIQTKGLGLLFSKSELALKAFLQLDQIKNSIRGFDLLKADRLIINSELVSKSNKFRADIVMRFYKNEKPLIAILIEAKSISKGIPVFEVNKQIERYLNQKVFKELDEFGKNVLGITLTKYPSISNHNNLISITWSDLIKAFYKFKGINEDLLHDYFHFLTNINGTMKFYESEVYSIPTAGWSSNAIEKFHIYECPNTGNHLIKQKPLFLTFRDSKRGGEMKNLYKVDNLIILNFKRDLKTFIDKSAKASPYDPRIKDRVKKYSDYMLSLGKWPMLPPDDKQVFILSENPITLPNKPRPAKNNSFRAYYDLADLLNNTIV